jgi:hypothetical protein
LIKLYTQKDFAPEYHIFQHQNWMPLVKEVKELLHSPEGEARSDLIFGV